MNRIPVCPTSPQLFLSKHLRIMPSLSHPDIQSPTLPLLIIPTRRLVRGVRIPATVPPKLGRHSGWRLVQGGSDLGGRAPSSAHLLCPRELGIRPARECVARSLRNACVVCGVGGLGCRHGSHGLRWLCLCLLVGWWVGLGQVGLSQDPVRCHSTSVCCIGQWCCASMGCRARGLPGIGRLVSSCGLLLETIVGMVSRDRIA